MRDPYRVLGVDRRADNDTIRKAYRKLARQWHPDVNREDGAEERFKEINAAYDIVGDVEKRKLWDDFGEASTRPGFDARRARAWRGAGGGRPSGGSDFGNVNVDDILSSIFGQGAGFERGPRRGADQTVDLAVDFLMTVRGGEQRITLRRPDGRTESLDVPIPAGASDGGKVRLKGQGLPPRGGGPCGDLLVRLRVSEHDRLTRHEDDLEMEVPITVLEAVRGASITVPTPTGDIRLTIPAGVGSGTRLRVKGRGIQRRTGAGDLYVILRPTVPNSDDPEVIAAAERIERAYPTDPRADLKL